MLLLPMRLAYPPASFASLSMVSEEDILRYHHHPSDVVFEGVLGLAGPAASTQGLSAFFASLRSSLDNSVVSIWLSPRSFHPPGNGRVLYGAVNELQCEVSDGSILSLQIEGGNCRYPPSFCKRT